MLPLTLLVLFGGKVFFLSCSGVLEPDLRDSLAETCELCDPLKVLTVGVRVDLEVGLEHLQLLVGKGCSNSLALGLPTALALCWETRRRTRRGCLNTLTTL